jgi:hypothetical protein
LFYAVVAFFEKVGVNKKKGANQNYIPFIGKRLAFKGRSQPKGVKPKMRDLKLRSVVNWQGPLKQQKKKWVCCKINTTI